MATRSAPPAACSTGISGIASDLATWTRLAATESAEALAGYPLGQVALRRSDRALWLLEKTAQWCLPPPAKKEERALLTGELTRPLPWLLFLPALLVLRVLRELVSFAALLVGKGPLRPSEMVRSIQNWRRSLRAVKYHGMRRIRSRTQAQAGGGGGGWLRALCCRARQALCCSVVRYSNGKQPMALRRNSGEPFLVCKRQLSPEEEDEETHLGAARALQDLAAGLELLPDTDSQDSDYSLKDVSNNLDTSYTSTDEEGQDEASESEVRPVVTSELLLENSTSEHSKEVSWREDPTGADGRELEPSSPGEVGDSGRKEMEEMIQSCEEAGSSSVQTGRSSRTTAAVPTKSHLTKPRRSKISYRSFQPCSPKGPSHRAKSESPRPVSSDKSSNRSAEKTSK